MPYKCRICSACKEELREFYMVKKEIWLSVMPDHTGDLHFACLEKKLGRLLTIEDFPNVDANRTIRFGYVMGRRTP